jgi:hypothetical protein
MSLLGRIEGWLGDYAQWRNAPPPDLWVNSGIESRTEVIDGDAVLCKPDGGMADFVQTHQRMLRIERAARAVQDALPFLPPMLKEVFDATYIGLPLEVPRPDREAAARMGVSLTKYQKMKFGLLCWFWGVHFQAFAVVIADNESGARASQQGEKAA